MWGVKFWRRRRATADDLRHRLIRAEEANRRLFQQREEANRLVNQHEATIAQFNNAVQDWQRELAAEQVLTTLLTEERDEARRELAEAAAENVALVDAKRHLEASLSGVREELRQAQREIARVGQEAAEMALTADGLGLAMAELERAAERRVILPGQRANLDDLGEEKRYEDGQGDQ